MDGAGKVAYRFEGGIRWHDAEANVSGERATMDDVRRELFSLIDETPWLDWQLLTKRPENIGRMWPDLPWSGSPRTTRLRKNVWIGISVSDQATADKMIPSLVNCHSLSDVLFLSCEPLLAQVDLHKHLFVGPEGGWEYEGSKRNFIDWVIVGGESGTNARSCRQTWIRDLVRQCADAGIPIFVKQFGSNAEEGFGVHRKFRFKDAKGGDSAEWPEDLRVREFPQTTVKADHRERD